MKIFQSDRCQVLKKNKLKKNPYVDIHSDFLQWTKILIIIKENNFRNFRDYFSYRVDIKKRINSQVYYFFQNSERKQKIKFVRPVMSVIIIKIRNNHFQNQRSRKLLRNPTGLIFMQNVEFLMFSGARLDPPFYISNV